MTDGTDTDDDLHLYFEIEKAAPDGSFVRGWACVTSDEGRPVNVDWDGEVCPMPVLRAAVHEFMAGERVAKVMHDGQQTGAIVESVIVDDDFAKAMGITHKKRGWWAGMEVHCPIAKGRVVRGELKGFSLGGRGSFHPPVTT